MEEKRLKYIGKAIMKQSTLAADNLQAGRPDKNKYSHY